MLPTMVSLNVNILYSLLKLQMSFLTVLLSPYTFRATSYASTWYHSHFSLQYTNGLIGPLVIYGPSSANWHIDLGPLKVTDWCQKPAFRVYYKERTFPSPADNALFNGGSKWILFQERNIALC